MTATQLLQSMLQEAAALRQAGRAPEAVAAYERLLARWPALPESWYNLAFLQRQIGRYEAALASYQQALDRGVAQPEEVHLNRGVIYADHLLRNEEAERELVAALAINPRYAPALLNLANLKEDLGERSQALALYERILVFDPGHPEALARIANLTTLSDPSDPLIAKLKHTLTRNDLSESAKANLAFALGKALNDCRAYREAFAAYAAANAHSRASAGPGRALYDRRRHEQLVDQIIETFVPGRFPAPVRPDADPPIFICGMFRSGSTLIEQVLASHPRVTSGGEVDILPAIVRSSLTPFPAAMRDLSTARLAELSAKYLDDLATLFPAADRITDKRPDNFLYIGVIKSLFPNARIVNTVRDPLDNCLSVYFLHLDHSMGYALDLMDIGHYYRQYRRLMAHWKSLYADDILDFDYDEFVREPKPAVERLLAFCELDWNDACLAFHQTKNTVKTASVWQVREPLYRRSSGRWRNYAAELAPLKAYLDELNR